MKKPTIKIATASTPDGGEMVLYQHDQDYFILVNGEELMTTRQHESELELARLGCAHLVGKKESSVLIGGLGMGYTLRETLDMMGSDASIVVGEFMETVVEWNRDPLGALNDFPLDDPRVNLQTGDVVELIAKSKNRFDAILLDIDNGPEAFTEKRNGRLYSPRGIDACRHALRKNGTIAVWSSEPSKSFEQLLMSRKLHVRRYRVKAYKAAKTQFRFVWVASACLASLPSGGGEPRPATAANSRRPSSRQGHGNRGRKRFR